MSDLTITPGSATSLQVAYTAADGSNIVLPAGYAAVFTMGAFTAGGLRGSALITKASAAGALSIVSDGVSTSLYFALTETDTAGLGIGIDWAKVVVYRPDGSVDGELDFTIAIVGAEGSPAVAGLFPEATAQVKSAFAATVDNPLILADGTAEDDGSPTLLRMVNQIAEDLDRTDLNGPIRNAIRNAIGFWQRERFAFNDGVLSFQTVPGQAGYGGSYLAGQNVMLAIDSAVAIDASNTTWALKNVPLSSLEALGDQNQSGEPAYFAKFSEGYRLFPIPDDVYTIRFTGHIRLGAPATDADTNAWVDEAYDLIAAYAKRWLAIHRLKDPQLKAAMDVAVGEASASLKNLATTMASTGVVQAYHL